jgi:competence protein ComGC
MDIISIVVAVKLFALIFWVRWVGTKGQNDLMKAMREQQKTYNVSLNALGGEFTLYQLRTDREFAELKKEIEIKSKQNERANEKLIDELPVRIRKVIGHIEFAKPLDR